MSVKLKERNNLEGKTASDFAEAEHTHNLTTDINIDADKNWNGKSIDNIGHLQLNNELILYDKDGNATNAGKFSNEAPSDYGGAYIRFQPLNTGKYVHFGLIPTGSSSVPSQAGFYLHHGNEVGFEVFSVETELVDNQGSGYGSNKVNSIYQWATDGGSKHPFRFGYRFSNFSFEEILRIETGKMTVNGNIKANGVKVNTTTGNERIVIHANGWSHDNECAVDGIKIVSAGSIGDGIGFKVGDYKGYIYFGGDDSWVGPGSFGFATDHTGTENDIKFRIKSDGNVDISGVAVRIRQTRTPTSSSDTIGEVGDISWDDDYIYVKTHNGWKRAALSTF